MWRLPPKKMKYSSTKRYKKRTSSELVLDRQNLLLKMQERRYDILTRFKVAASPRKVKKSITKIQRVKSFDCHLEFEIRKILKTPG